MGNLCLVCLFIVMWVTEKEEPILTNIPDLKFSKVHLTPGIKELNIYAEKGSMTLKEEWEINLTQLKPFESNGHSMSPASLSFLPKSGELILNEIQFEDRVKINQVVMGPSVLNISFKGLEAKYSFNENDSIAWSGWQVDRLESRDALKLWPIIMKYTQGDKLDSAKGIKLDQDEGLNRSEKRAYAFRAKSLSIHQSMIHVRIALEEIVLETKHGLVKAPIARLNANDSLVTMKRATVEADGQIESMDRLVFNFKTGSLETK